MKCSFILTFYLLIGILQAFPPLPPTVITGKVRGEYGYSANYEDFYLVLLSGAGTEIARTKIEDIGVYGRNYKLKIPLDFDLSSGGYNDKATEPGEVSLLSFAAELSGVRIPVIQATATDEEITMESGSEIVIDFTLGEDTDGDNLPDSWEEYQASLVDGFSGDALTLFKEGGDFDNDGLSDYGEYTAGTFAGLFSDKIDLRILKINHESQTTALEFLAVEGKTYQLKASADLKEWYSVPFTLEDKVDATASAYFAANNTVYQVIVAQTPTELEGKNLLYKVFVD